jgi:hypothetical protein
MNATIEDLRPTIIPKSDQLNAEQLLGGPMTVTVVDVRLGSGEDQPVVVHYDGEEGRPFKPCKTMRKVLIHAWGSDGRQWAGRSMTLYNDHSVKWAGEDVGGIRISHMSDIERDIKVSLTTTRGKKAKYEVKRMERSPTLPIVLEAIAAASNKATMGAAKALAGRLTSAADISAAVAAYNARAAVLKAKPASAKTLAQFKADIDNATDAEIAALVMDQARDAMTPTEYDELAEHYRTTWSQ